MIFQRALGKGMGLASKSFSEAAWRIFTQTAASLDFLFLLDQAKRKSHSVAVNRGKARAGGFLKIKLTDHNKFISLSCNPPNPNII